MFVSRIMRRALLPSALLIAPLMLAAQTPPEPPVPPAPAPELYKMTIGGSFLGVGVREIDSSRAKVLNLREEYGVEITKVEEDSPAEKAGLKMGDVVIEYQGQRVEGTEQFVRLVRETPVGRTVKMNVARGGSTVPVTRSSRSPARRFYRAGERDDRVSQRCEDLRPAHAQDGRVRLAG